MKKAMKQALTYCEKSFRDFRLDIHYKRELANLEKHSEKKIENLSIEDCREIEEYYRALGFPRIDTRWHRYLYSVTGRMEKKCIPENFYHLTIEPLFTRGDPAWEDKAYMHRFLPDVVFPQTIVKRVNGYYLNDRDEIISFDEAKNLVCQNETVIIKPSRNSGGGRGVSAIGGSVFDQEIVDSYGRNFIVQKKIDQQKTLSQFNSSSVNTEKIISFLYKGEVFILTSILRVGEPGAVTDTASTGRGYTIGIQNNGQLNTVGYNIFGHKFTEDATGRKFSGICLDAHKEICAIIKKAHKTMPYFGLISWDFAVDSKGRPILIEYNLNYPDILIYQMNNGPLFGANSDEWLRDISKMEN